MRPTSSSSSSHIDPSQARAIPAGCDESHEPDFALEPTALAVGDAVAHYRQSQQISRDELAGSLEHHGHPISPARLRLIEHGRLTVTVDDLVALAYVLSVSPAVLLGHLPLQTPGPEQPLGTGLPDDLGYAEYQQWLRDQISLDPASRRDWYQDKRLQMRLRFEHLKDQLDAARDELDDLDHVHEQELDTARVSYLQGLVRQLEETLNDTDQSLRVTEHQIEILAGRGGSSGR
ncbi:helix-turn-helix transcriptional regulator [Kocuria palustris]|uniref:helix-turn-helix domain-containing protein n=1 Tax=Kocuria palustris TaxID=71999 RepID=UPI0028D05720|nr:helix-turn-helix transcriptional regulator [Kocuria palustris]